MTSVTRAVKTVTDAVRTVDIDVCVQGTEDSRYAFCIRQIYDSVKETVTNTMRYSSAERIDIIIKFLGDRNFTFLTTARAAVKLRKTTD